MPSFSLVNNVDLLLFTLLSHWFRTSVAMLRLSASVQLRYISSSKHHPLSSVAFTCNQKRRNSTALISDSDTSVLPHLCRSNDLPDFPGSTDAAHIEYSLALDSCQFMRISTHYLELFVFRLPGFPKSWLLLALHGGSFPQLCRQPFREHIIRLQPVFLFRCLSPLVFGALCLQCYNSF